MIQSIHRQTGHAIRPICQVLGVPRSSYYHASEPTPCQSADLVIGLAIQSIFKRHRRRYGYRRIHAELAEELCISANLLYSWKSSSQAAQGGSEGGRAEGENAAADALRGLRRENALLRQENDILKKAAVILGTKTQPNYAR